MPSKEALVNDKVVSLIENVKKVSSVDPRYSQPLAELKASYQELTDAFSKVKGAYLEADVGFLPALKSAMDEHTEWVTMISAAIMEGLEELGVETSPEKTALGKFLSDPKWIQYTGQFPKLKTHMDQARAALKDMCDSAEKINDAMVDGDSETARSLFVDNFSIAERLLKKHLMEAIKYQGQLLSQKEARDAYQRYFIPVVKRLDDSLNVIHSVTRDLVRMDQRARAIYSEETLPAKTALMRLFGQCAKELMSATTTDESLLAAARSLKRNVLLLGMGAITIALVAAFFISRKLIRSLKHISQQMGEGANQVAAASIEVSSAIQSLAGDASRQAASLEEVSSTLQELASQTKQNSRNASEAKEMAGRITQIMDQADQSMGDLTRSMEEIMSASEKTSKIIKTIDEIAFQTNLLALNAAVEAARAGEAGAGFAVVADEVRNLAMRAADAAKETTKLLEETTNSVETGSGLVSRTNEVFSEVSSNISKISQLVKEIATASQEQAEGIQQVSNGAEEIETVTQRSAATTEECASAAEQLSAQAETMKSVAMDLEVLIGGKRSSQDRAPFETEPEKKAPDNREDQDSRVVPMESHREDMETF